MIELFSYALASFSLAVGLLLVRVGAALGNLGIFPLARMSTCPHLVGRFPAGGLGVTLCVSDLADAGDGVGGGLLSAAAGRPLPQPAPPRYDRFPPHSTSSHRPLQPHPNSQYNLKHGCSEEIH